MKLIPSESGLANSVEKREFSIENACHKLPKCIRNSNTDEKYDNEHKNREICLWKMPNNLRNSEITNYVNNLKKKGYREDQALLALQCNNYNFTSAVGDICQYRPKIGLFELDVVETADKISKIMINNRKNNQNRKRCFRQIHNKFPNYTMGELLHFYMSNKLKIKRRLAKYKKQFEKLSKIPSPEEYERIISKLKNKDENLLEGESVIKSESDEMWSRQEVYNFFQALGMFGENFLMISQFIGNKSESMVKLFYAQNVKNAM